MELKEVYQSMANLKYIVTTGQPELIVKEDIQNLINYIENNSIPKEKVKELIKEELTYRNELPDNAVNTREMHEYTRLTLVELLGDDE